MAEIYVFAPNEDDFTSMGLAGALEPTSCEHEEMAGGQSVLTLVHPLDDMGRYKLLQRGVVVKAPVPVRTTPEIDMDDPDNPKRATTVERWSISQGAGRSDRTLWSKSQNGKKKKVLAPYSKVTVVKKAPVNRTRHKVKTKWGTGWVEVSALEYEVTQTIPDQNNGIEEVEPAWRVKDQLFRVYDVKMDDKAITVKARHITYDLLGNCTTYSATKARAGTALQSVLANCIIPHDFEVYTDMRDERFAIDWRDINPIKALLDPEEGFVGRWGGQIVRDDFEIFALRKAGMNRGVQIEHAKNLTGIDYTESDESVITRIIPVGQTEKGKPLYLSGTRWVDSPHIGAYPVPHVHVLDCSGSCKVSKDMSTNQARNEMRRQAEQMLEDGCDLPKVSLRVNFINLGDTEEYKQYAELEDVYLYDTIQVLHPRLGLFVDTEIVRVKFDVLHEKVLEVETGSLRKLNQTVTTWQIPRGVSGGKILMGSISGAQLGDGVISADQLQANSVVAGTIAAEAVTAGTIAAGAIEAGHIGAEQIDAGHIRANALDAMIANIARAEIGSADINYANIKDLVAGTALITEGVGGKLFIHRLNVTDANIVELDANKITVGTLAVERLVIVGTDKSIVYTINQANGTAQLSSTTIDGGSITQKTITADNIVAGTITAGELGAGAVNADKILALAVQAGHIATDAILARHIKANEITADKIKAGSLGAINLIKNGRGEFGTASWRQFGAHPFSTETISPENGGGGRLTLQVAAGALGHLYQDIYGMERNTQYTLTLLARSAPRNLVIGFAYKANAADTDWTYGPAWTMPPSWFHTISHTFVTPDQPIAIARINIQMQNDTASAADLSAGNVMLQKGGLYTGYAPHPSEVKDGVVAISGDGVEVTHNDMPGVKTTLKKDGLRIVDGDTFVGGLYKLPGMPKAALAATALVDPDPGGVYIQSGKYHQAFGLLFCRTDNPGVGHGGLYADLALGTFMRVYLAGGFDDEAVLNIERWIGVTISAYEGVDIYSGKDVTINASWDENGSVIVDGRRLIPERDGEMNLGRGSNRWNAIYAKTSTINTSDLRDKKDVQPLGDEAARFILALNPVVYKWIESDSNRDHFGLIAQDVRDAMHQAGIDDFGGFIRAPKDNSTPYSADMSDDQVRYGLRYEEFVAPLIATVQAQQRQIEALDARIARIETVLRTCGGGGT